MRRCTGIVLAGMFVAVGVRAQEPVTVDFAVSDGPVTHIGSGMLQSISVSQPETKYVMPLKFQSFRLDGNRAGQLQSTPWDLYDRVTSVGAKDLYYVLGPMGVPKTDGRDAWFSKRDAAIQEVVGRSLKEHKRFIWDIWNEPNLIMPPAHGDHVVVFASEQEWLDVWDRTYRSIRKADPKARIFGPSYGYTNLDLKQLMRFVEHCGAAHTMPDIVDWHFGDLAEYHEAAKALRARAKELGYEIQLAAGESVPAGSDMNLDAGFPAYLFAVAERERMETVHATWSSNPLLGEAQDNAAELAGLTTREKKIPRGVWWTYETYGEMSGQMSPVVVAESSKVDGVASVDAAKHEAIVLLGTKKIVGGAAEVKLEHLDTAGVAGDGVKAVRVQVLRIPFSEVDLAAPFVVSDSMMEVKGGELKVAVKVGDREAAVVKVSRGTPEKKVDAGPVILNRSATLEVFPAKDMPVASPRPTKVVENEHGTRGAWSQVSFTGAGDSATYKFVTGQARDVLLWVRYFEGVHHPIVEISVDGKKTCGPIDTYSTKHVPHEVSCGVVSLATGTHALTVTVVGKNPESGGFEFELDAIRLATVQDQVVLLADMPESDVAKLAVPGKRQAFVVKSRLDGTGTHFVLPMLPAGKYHVAVGYQRGPEEARFAMLLDGVPVGVTHSAKGEAGTAVLPGDDESEFSTAIVTPESKRLDFVPVGFATVKHNVSITAIVLTRYKE